MCDDVFKKTNQNDPLYKSIASWETIEAFKNAGIIDPHYFLKRIGKSHKQSRKYVGYLTLKKR